MQEGGERSGDCDTLGRHMTINNYIVISGLRRWNVHKHYVQDIEETSALCNHIHVYMYIHCSCTYTNVGISAKQMCIRIHVQVYIPQWRAITDLQFIILS